MQNNTKSFILTLPRPIKRLVVVLADVSISVLSVWLAYYLRLGEFVFLSGSAITAVFISVFLAVPIFYLFGFYRVIFRHNDWATLEIIAFAVFVYSLFYASIFTAFGVSGVPRTIGIIQPILLFLFLGSSRILARLWLGGRLKKIFKNNNSSKVFIYGAGEAGLQLARAISGTQEMEVVGFLDDNKDLQGNLLRGQKIYNPSELPFLSKLKRIDGVLLAMPSVNRKRRNEILTQIQEAQVSVRTLPSVLDLVKGNVTISDLRELDIDDLLGRETVIPNEDLLSNDIAGKIVMVTGAGGSIGGELCRQIIVLGPQKLLLVEQGEFSLYDIHQELESKKLGITIIPLLASVQDVDRMGKLFSTWRPHTVYHAAAYKHVPLVEHNLLEGIKNNVLGTTVAVQAAIAHKVKKFVLVSTDKAVRPTNIMGASKRLAEMVLQALKVQNHFTKLSIVRFGNVLGSSGSVVPKFREQIKKGGPITITHPEITRFFMTVSEAAQLVIQAGAMAKGGDVFVLDMGQPVKIIDLAERMVELSGLSLKNEENPDGDIEVEITKLRPGEKLYEELLIGNNPEPTSHNRIMKAHEHFLDWENLEGEIKELTVALKSNDTLLVRDLLEKLVTDYQPNNDIVDWVFLEQQEETKIN